LIKTGLLKIKKKCLVKESLENELIMVFGISFSDYIQVSYASLKGFLTKFTSFKSDQVFFPLREEVVL
jgi:hypothetical protein